MQMRTVAVLQRPFDTHRVVSAFASSPCEHRESETDRSGTDQSGTDQLERTCGVGPGERRVDGETMAVVVVVGADVVAGLRVVVVPGS